MKLKARFIPALAAISLTTASAHGAITIQSDNFNTMNRTGTGNLTAISDNPTQEAASGWKDVTSQFNALSVSTGANARSDQLGFGGTYGSADTAGVGVRVRSSTGAMTLDNAMQLTTLAQPQVTITFDLRENSANYFLALQYSSDAAFTTPITIATFDGNTPADLGVWRFKSYTITNGEGGVVFSNDAYFMIRKVSGSGVTGANSTFHTFDNIVITAIPEPSAALLGGLGLLALLLRRR